jgi:hypothetical protein
MKLDIWKKAQRRTILMIRCFIDTYVDAAGDSSKLVSCSRELSILKVSKAYAGVVT